MSYKSYIKCYKDELDFISKDIIFTGKVLYKEGLVTSHAGNISVKHKDSIIITKTGRMLGFLKKEDLITVSIDKPQEKDKEASSELIVHREIYKKTDAKAIIHAHPIYATSLTFKMERYFEPIDNEGKLFIGTVPIVDVEKATASLELAQEVSSVLKEYNLCLVKTHGVFVKADSLNYALKLCSDLEFCAKIYTLARL
ncbi:MAG: aldolase [Aquificae bacterium]|nr:aldolase [Aquificota bacterium]